MVLGDELRRRAVIAEADEATRKAVEAALREQHIPVEPENEQRPQAVLVGADSPTTPFEVVGWSQNKMVDQARLRRNRQLRVEALRRALLEQPRRRVGSSPA